MYTLAEYGAMIVDRVRIDAYHRALARVIRPDSVVLDIGAGAGIMSLLACRLGARRVVAIEPAASIHVARAIADANGYRDRIEFIEGLSTDVVLSERADVIVSDLRGVLPLHLTHIPSLIDARARLLAPGGTLIPREDVIRAAPVEAPDVYDSITAPWTGGIWDLDLQRARAFATNSWRKARIAPGQLLAPSQEWVTLSYESLNHPGAHHEMSFAVERAGTIHGFVVWFDADLGGVASFSNAPGQPELIYGQGFFPLTEPVAVGLNDTVWLDLRADLVGEAYVWQWSTRIAECASPEQFKASYRQSTFSAEPIAASSLRKRAANFVPRRKPDATIDGMILSMMDGQTPSGDIARAVMASFPSRFRTWEAALARVGEVSREYSE
jgi:type I protein arginine methyltransferase